MKGIGIHQFGDIQQFCEVELETPLLHEKDVLVQVKASSVQVSDWRLRAGQIPTGYDHFPMILGSAGAGIVKAIGLCVTDFKVGDKVFFKTDISTYGTYANESVIASSNICHMPHNLTYIESAAIIESSLAAWQAVKEGEIREETAVLILGESQSNKGRLLLQLLNAKRARIDVFSCDSQQRNRHHMDLNRYGLHQKCFQFDVLIDINSQYHTYKEASNWLKPKGKIIRMSTNEMNENVKISKHDDNHLTDMTIRPEETKEGLEEIRALVEYGQLTPSIAKVYSLTIEGLQKAHIKKQYGKEQGAIVICHREET